MQCDLEVCLDMYRSTSLILKRPAFLLGKYPGYESSPPYVKLSTIKAVDEGRLDHG